MSFCKQTRQILAAMSSTQVLHLKISLYEIYPLNVYIVEVPLYLSLIHLK